MNFHFQQMSQKRYKPSVEIEGESEQTVYLFFCIAVQSNGEIEKYYNDYKKDLESAVIQADITEVDGTEHTQYFGIRQKYETSDTPAYLELYLLEMEQRHSESGGLP